MVAAVLILEKSPKVTNKQRCVAVAFKLYRNGSHERVDLVRLKGAEKTGPI